MNKLTRTERITKIIANLESAQNGIWEALDQSHTPAIENQDSEYAIFAKIQNMLGEARRLEK